MCAGSTAGFQRAQRARLHYRFLHAPRRNRRIDNQHVGHVRDQRDGEAGECLVTGTFFEWLGRSMRSDE